MTCKLESTLIGRDLSLQDNEFVECVLYDVQFFVKNCNDNSNKSVLVFPPVNNYRRFLIHKVVEEQSHELSTFSIGQGHARRTVVCFKRHVIKKPTLENESERALTPAMGVDLDGPANNTTLSHETATKRAKATPAMGIYRPPAARKQEEQVLTTSPPAPLPDKPRSGKTRRPDIQVYVPRAKRMEVYRKCSLALSRSSEESVDTKAPCSELSENKKNQRNSRGDRLSASNLVISTNSSPLSNNKRKPEHSKRFTDAGKLEEKPLEVKLMSVDVHVGKKVKQDDIDMDVVISDTDKIHRSAFITKTEPLNTRTERKLEEETASARKHMSERKLLSDLLIISDSEPMDNKEQLSGSKLSSDSLIISDSEPMDNKEQLSERKPSSDSLIISDSEPMDNKEQLSERKLLSDSLIISDSEPMDNKEQLSERKLSSNSVTISDSEPVDNKEPSARKLSSDSLIISDSEPADNNLGKQESSAKKVPSDVLIISDLEPVDEKQQSSGKKVPSNVLMISDWEPSNSASTKQTSSVEKNTLTSDKQAWQTNCKKTEQQKQAKEREVPLNLNPDECTWEMLFDDNGDCLDPRLMEELTSAVGSVTIEKPQSDYRSYQSRVEMMLSGNAEDEFAHVLEIYNFPPEFKTQDLFTVFSPYMKNGFEIKWVDDTHALGVFSSALIAAEVLAADHPFVKTRPLHQATPESRMKARRSAEFLQPYRARPETCAAMARRLVTGALGVRLRTSAEEREAERRLLREARERKRLAARQRDEAWEGTLMSNK